MQTIEQIAQTAKQVSYQLASLSEQKKNALLHLIADRLIEQTDAILLANELDVNQAKQQGIAESLQVRLSLSKQQLIDLAQTVRATASLPDPSGKLLEKKVLPSGLKLQRISTPLGVVAVIYESRPNVTIDVATLGIKSGNAVILRGGKEALNTNRCLVAIIQQALVEFDLAVELVQFIDRSDRELINQLLQQHQYIDLLIPRGGAALQRLCTEQSSIPTITGGIGVCHIFVDKTADLTKAIEIIDNAKTQRPGVCNAVETVLIHSDIRVEFLLQLADNLAKKQVTLHVTPEIAPLLQGKASSEVKIVPLEPGDLDKEWLSLDVNLVLVADTDAAVAHIRRHGTGHSEVILTQSPSNSMRFVQQVDAAVVYVNASSRFTDGAEFGLGSEVAVSTQKMHARGPVGLEALVTYKWVGYANYLSRK